MSRAPISRRSLVAGAGVTLATAALPAGVVEALAADMPPAVDPAALPTVFDPAAFVADLRAAGFSITACRSAWIIFDNDEDLRPGFHITPADGRGMGRRYCEVMRRWSDAMDACPNLGEQVVRYLSEQTEDEP